MQKVIDGKWMTVREVAERLSVSRQRVHRLISIYDVAVKRVNDRMLLIDANQLKKIPQERPHGKHIDKR